MNVPSGDYTPQQKVTVTLTIQFFLGLFTSNGSLLPQIGDDDSRSRIGDVEWTSLSSPVVALQRPRSSSLSGSRANNSYIAGRGIPLDDKEAIATVSRRTDDIRTTKNVPKRSRVKAARDLEVLRPPDFRLPLTIFFGRVICHTTNRVILLKKKKIIK